MRRTGLVALCVIALPAAAAEPTDVTLPDPEFLEFLAELPDEDAEFVAFLETQEAERELQRAEKAAAKEKEDE